MEPSPAMSASFAMSDTGFRSRPHLLSPARVRVYVNWFIFYSHLCLPVMCFGHCPLPQCSQRGLFDSPRRESLEMSSLNSWDCVRRRPAWTERHCSDGLTPAAGETDPRNPGEGVAIPPMLDITAPTSEPSDRILRSGTITPPKESAAEPSHIAACGEATTENWSASGETA